MKSKMNRRDFVVKSGLSGSALFLSDLKGSMAKSATVKIGIITDLHHDIMHDAIDRLSKFIEAMNHEKPDFIIQAGDFCIPKKENKPLLDVWNQFDGPRHHVLGNHDTDGGYTREQTVAFWNAQGKYYSFDQSGFHFIVLDGNEHNESESRPPGYARYISATQLNWLRDDLKNTTLPTVVFCHQGLDNDAGGLENGTLLRYTLEQEKSKTGKPKVKMVISGHHHQDYCNLINDIHYVQINSASYQWLGGDYQEIRYSKEVDKARPNIKYTVPYREPIWAVIEIVDGKEIRIKGKKTEFVGSSPADLQVEMDTYIYPIVPFISDRILKI
ncbi:calcineurin-like phosphoesterase family protein [Dyadobacter jejuensis]|uniref:Calcineurin-like phosphoesterase family protein n=1 Tax=Dyadobacter jejuensis TaxID=1082580 RepID=A0A316AP89_9BACT|nr:metallophosphoesterase [Dyadobacter jejuensis]PWJ59311.1 calcineurin-like phosphoesterase family protein [Dyadobacter jejuensis]